MFKRMLIMLIIVGAIFGGIFGYHAFSGMMMKKYLGSGTVAPVTVSAVKVELESWQPKIKAVGSLRAVQGVDVTSEIAGLVQKVFFKSGDEVKDGQPLVKLNADTDTAQLDSLEAAADLAKTVYDRDKKQFEIQAVSQAAVDADAAELKSRRAQVAQQVAVVAKKMIRAPFAGKLGISFVNPGQYINPGEKIVTLQSLDLVYADFYLPQQELSRISIDQMVVIRSDTYPDRSFSGKVTAVNSKVEVDSRNIQIEAVIPNPKRELLPGMFVTVEVEAGAPKKYLTLPQTAVIFNPYGETVYVVEDKGKDAQGKPALIVKQTFVTIGETRGDQLSVLSGIKEGDLIVTTGQHKLRNGSTVTLNNQVLPGNDSIPVVVDQ